MKRCRVFGFCFCCFIIVVVVVVLGENFSKTKCVALITKTTATMQSEPRFSLTKFLSGFCLVFCYCYCYCHLLHLLHAAGHMQRDWRLSNLLLLLFVI